jgi:hypothetical protein
MRAVNNGSRSLLESTMSPEVVAAVRHWARACRAHAVLIGGLALSFHVKPRMTQDVDVLFARSSDIPNEVDGFQRLHAGGFQDRRTGVKVDVFTPETINVPSDVVERVFRTAVQSDGMRIASPSGLVALKLFRLRMQDKADIVELIKAANVSLEGFPLSDDQLHAYGELVKQAEVEKRLDRQTAPCR